MSSAVQTHEISRNFQNFFYTGNKFFKFLCWLAVSLYHGQGAQRVRLKGVHQACRAYTYNKTYSCSFKGETNIKFTEIPTGHAAKTVSRL